MFTKKSISRVFSVLFILVFMLALATPVDVAQSSPVESAKADEATNQFLPSFGAALGGIILAPVWYIWTGLRLRQASV